MKVLLKSFVSILLIILFTLPAISAAAESSDSGKVYSYIPEVEEQYDGVEDFISDAIRNLKASINISSYKIPVSEIVSVFKSAVFSNPDIFYVDASYIHYTYNKSNNIIKSIQPIYLFSASEIPSKIKKFNKAVNAFLSDIDDSMSETQKALAIHDKIALNCEYKLKGLISYTAYSALVDKKSVCEGYVRAYNYLLAKVGVDSKCINNNAKSHCWNIVKIDGKWYHVDVTHDDPTPETKGYVRHKYFLVSDKKLASYNSTPHSGYKDDASYNSDYKCSSTSYDSAFFRNVTSQVLYVDGICYYIDSNYRNKGYAALIEKFDDWKRAVKVMKDTWYTSSGKKYRDTFSKLFYKDGNVYFNSKREIYRYSVYSDNLKRIFKMPSFWTTDFYGIGEKNSYIYGVRRKEPTETANGSRLVKILSRSKTLTLPYVRRTSVTVRKGKLYIFKVYKGSGSVTYRSSNRKIALVTSSGRVRAIKCGTCTITAKKNGITFKLKLKVKKRGAVT